MEKISYMQAGASCLPVVGPFLGIANYLTEGIKFSSTVASLCKMKSKADGKSKFDFEQILQSPELKNQYLSFKQKHRLYAICNMVGTVLTIATIVGLVAFAIFTGIDPVSQLSWFGLEISACAGVWACGLYQDNPEKKQKSIMNRNLWHFPSQGKAI